MTEMKRFFYPVPLEELFSIKSTSINQEKELDFQQRKNNMERDALKEEKLRAEKERGQKFMESEFDFKGEDEEIEIPNVEIPANLKFKTSNKTKNEFDQVFSVVEYAKLPDNVKDLFSLKKTKKGPEDDSIEYVNFDKSTQPNLHKYSRKLKIRKVESNIVNLYDVGMKSLLTSTEISKRAELLAKLYMKHHYDEDKYGKAMEEEKKSHLKRLEKNKLNPDSKKNTQGGNQNGSLTEKQKEETRGNINDSSSGGQYQEILSEYFPPPLNVKLPPAEEVMKFLNVGKGPAPFNPAMFKLPFGKK